MIGLFGVKIVVMYVSYGSFKSVYDNSFAGLADSWPVWLADVAELVSRVVDGGSYSLDVLSALVDEGERLHNVTTAAFDSFPDEGVAKFSDPVLFGANPVGWSPSDVEEFLGHTGEFLDNLQSNVEVLESIKVRCAQAFSLQLGSSGDAGLFARLLNEVSWYHMFFNSRAQTTLLLRERLSAL